MGRSKSVVITEGRTVPPVDFRESSQVISIRLPRHLVESINEIREQNGVSFSDLVRPHLEQLAIGEEGRELKIQTTVKQEEVKEVPKKRASNSFFDQFDE